MEIVRLITMLSLFYKRSFRIPTAATEGPKYVYISRRGTESFRLLSNEDEVEAVVMRFGFAGA